MGKFDRVIIFAILFLAGLAVGIWAIWQFAGQPTPADPRSGQTVGVRGPFAIQFGVPVDQINAQKHIHFDPLLVGNFSWQDNTAFFWPYEPLAIGQTYSVSVDDGILTTDGRSTRSGEQWQVRVRAPQVVYLSPSRSPELWRIDPQDGAPQKLTDTGGRVFDYAVSPDGENLVYSQYDDQGGISLWRVNRTGGSTEQLLDCGADWCVNPAFSPDGAQLAYARRQSGVSEGSSPGVPRVWTLDLLTGQTDRLYADPNISGSDPSWSPDGRFLTFFDGLSNGLRLANLETHQDNLLPADMGMTASWSPDGLSLYFTNIIVQETFAYENVYRYAIPTGQITPAFLEDVDPLDYSPVALSADGQWLVVGIREITGNPARQLWLMHPDGSQRQAITDDPLVNTSAFRWSPVGEQVVFQSLALGSSSAAPRVMLWDRSSGEIRLLSEDASQPDWIP